MSWEQPATGITRSARTCCCSPGQTRITSARRATRPSSVGKGGVSNTAAKQRQTGVYGEVLYTPKNWTFSGSARIDHFSNYDVNQFATATGASQPHSFSETPFDPRLGVTRRITQSWALSASAFRAYRSPN